MPLTLREENYPTHETSCEYGYTVHNGYIHCNHPGNIFIDGTIGITVVILLICSILYSIKLIAKSKYGKRIFPPFTARLTSLTRSNQNSINTPILDTNENGEIVIDDSAIPETVPKYTTNVDPNHDIGFYDNTGNFVPLPKPQPSHLTTFPYTLETNLSSSPQYSKNPPPYLAHPPQYLGSTLIS